MLPSAYNSARYVPSLVVNEQMEDGAVLAAIARKDPAAMETFFDRYRVLCYSLALRVLADPQDAEDVVQEAFVNVWRSAPTYRPDASSPRSWLLSIVHHRCIDKLRNRRARPKVVDLDGGMHMSDGHDVWREVADSLTAEEVRTALGHLPEEQREAIELAYFGGLTQTQIATRMAVPLGTVKGRMRLGLHRLRELLQPVERQTILE